MKVLSIAALLVIYAAGYFHGGYAEVSKYEKEANARLTETVRTYEDLLEREKVERERAVQIADRRLSDLNTVASQYDALRVQLSTESAGRESGRKQAADCRISAELSDRRLKQVEELIARATVLIRERDEIAVTYNALRKQCR